MSVRDQEHIVGGAATLGGGVGLLVGLFAPPLLAATAVGAGIGAIVGGLLAFERGHSENPYQSAAGARVVAATLAGAVVIGGCAFVAMIVLDLWLRSVLPRC